MKSPDFYVLAIKISDACQAPVGRPDRTCPRHPTSGAGARHCSGPWTKGHSSRAAFRQEPPSSHALQSYQGAFPAHLTAAVHACPQPTPCPVRSTTANTGPPLHAHATSCSAAGSLAPSEAKSQARLASFHLRVLYLSSVPHRHTSTSCIPPFSFQLSRAKSRVSLWGLTHTAGPWTVIEYASLAWRGDSTGVGRAVLAVQTGRQHRQSHAHSKVTQAALLPAQRRRALPPRGMRLDTSRKCWDAVRDGPKPRPWVATCQEGVTLGTTAGRVCCPFSLELHEQQRVIQSTSTAQGRSSNHKVPALQKHPTGEWLASFLSFLYKFPRNPKRLPLKTMN